MDRKLHSWAAAVALLGTGRSRLKRIETADDLYSCQTLREDDFARRPGFDRAVRVQGRAKSSSMPQMQPQRYPMAYDAIRRRATGLTLFSLLFFVLPGRKIRAAREGKKEQGQKPVSHMKLNRQPRYSNSSRRTSHASAFHTLDKPTGFVYELDGSRARHRRLLISRMFLSLTFEGIKKCWDIIHASFNALDRINYASHRFSLHFWIWLISFFLPVGIFELFEKKVYRLLHYLGHIMLKCRIFVILCRLVFLSL